MYPFNPETARHFLFYMLNVKQQRIQHLYALSKDRKRNNKQYILSSTITITKKNQVIFGLMH